MTKQPLVSLSIVSHGDAEKVSRLLDSIQMYEPGAKKIQIILTDNLGNDLPEYDPTQWASLQLIRNSDRKGLAYNNNRAFEFANGEFFGIINPDLVWNIPVIDPLITTIRSFHVDIAGPQIISTNGQVQDSYRPIPTPIELIKRRMPRYRFKNTEPDSKGHIHPDWIAGMFLLMPSSTYRKLNGMNEMYKLYFEDVDFCTRARLQGLSIIVDTNVFATHDAQRSSLKNPFYLYIHFISALRFFLSPIYRQARKLS